ncbi:excinuclease ABC subunit UvrA [uncultured Rikenella sp.]|uniref:excinuclease ABC subunit UvrA n=1 Tax=uncultured Rikenella sp. TaxID=368003 RepID=UPI0025D1CD69|nr:excinuclease ABC subunit UvrA [uncultured Rikenella sp.]
MEQYIHVKGARVHNLKDIEIKIPHNKLVVVTGLSGSGKSTLAFDTIFAEGQRRYVESLSAYARQFLGKIEKPDVDFITGIAPAIAVEQKVNTRNPRSTVGTTTEIYDYLRLLFARIGKTYSPVSGEEVKAHTVQDVVDAGMALPVGTRAMVAAPVALYEGQGVIEKLTLLMKDGFERLVLRSSAAGEVKYVQDILPEIDKYGVEELAVLIDRFSVPEGADEEWASRLFDSVQTAFEVGDGRCLLISFPSKEQGDRGAQFKEFSNRFEADGIVFQPPFEHMFSFNNPLGACPRCEGYGRVVGIDEDLVIPDKSKTIYDDAIVCWRGETMKWWKKQLVMNASKFGFPIHRPFYELSEEQRRLLWRGNSYFHGLDEFFEYLEKERYKIQYRVMLSRYTGKTLCPDCGGARLRPEALYVRVGGRTVAELVRMPVSELKAFFEGLQLDAHDAEVGGRALTEIKNRLQYLEDVGLAYLTLDRLSSTLSGGESQRINLATSLGSSLVGSLYILDEPSIGLHPRDTERLIEVLRQLRDLGNTVIVVEHDAEIIRAADEVIDIGPMAGYLGGEVVFQGAFPEMEAAAKRKGNRSLTVRYLTGREAIEMSKRARKWNSYIEIKGAREHNLKNIDVRIPLGVMTCITGVSGSGKSSLVKSILYPALRRALTETGDRPGDFDGLEGDILLLKGVEMIDQNPIGRSLRSNPVTYIKAYDEIRKLFTEQQLAKQYKFDSSSFSFNIAGGRCEECKGEGVIRVEMQFMADVELVCEACNGKRFRDEILQVRYHDKSIYDVLEMSIDEAIEFFGQYAEQDKINLRIIEKLKTLQDVGLGYVKLGQSSSTLSGGESQRVKLASFLLKENGSQPLLFIFDEPTTGLHFHDIRKLLRSFEALIQKGHTVVVVEHNMDVVKCADWVIDLGPEGGEAGGQLVFAGTPRELAEAPKAVGSQTARYLKEVIG